MTPVAVMASVKISSNVSIYSMDSCDLEDSKSSAMFKQIIAEKSKPDMSLPSVLPTPEDSFLERAGDNAAESFQNLTKTQTKSNGVQEGSDDMEDLDVELASKKVKYEF